VERRAGAPATFADLSATSPCGKPPCCVEPVGEGASLRLDARNENGARAETNQGLLCFMTLLLRRLIQPPIVEHHLHVVFDIRFDASHRRLPIKIFAKVRRVHRCQPRLRLVNPVLAHDASAIGGADFQGPDLALSASPTTPSVPHEVTGNGSLGRMIHCDNGP
jgi:hypothetical protein